VCFHSTRENSGAGLIPLHKFEPLLVRRLDGSEIDVNQLAVLLLRDTSCKRDTFLNSYLENTSWITRSKTRPQGTTVGGPGNKVEKDVLGPGERHAVVNRIAF
jgi:hypothetical protein